MREGPGKQKIVTRVHKTREVEVQSEHMCLQPDVIPSLPCGEMVRGINAAQWAVDQRPFIWAAASKPVEKPHASVWKGRKDAFYPGAPLLYSGTQIKARGSDEQFEADSSFSSGRYLCATTPLVPNDIEILQSKVWDPRPNGPAEDVWESPELKEERFLKSSWIEQLIEDDRMQRVAALKRKLISGSNDNRPAAPRKEMSARSKNVSMSESLSDNEDQSDDEGEGYPGVSEKRRKRMLSNRASAQRSRQRRQERLDTLEVLVAELRVENAALTRRANNAAITAKKSEEEVKILRYRLEKQEEVPLSDSNASNDSDKTTENSDVAVVNKSGDLWRAEAATSPERDLGASDYTEGTRHYDRYSRQSSRPSKAEGVDDDSVQPLKRWNSSISNSSLDFDFNSDPMERSATKHHKTSSRTTLPESNSGTVANVKDLYQSAMMSLAQSKSFQSLDPFGIDLEQCDQETDKNNLDSRTFEDIWLESLANCLK